MKKATLYADTKFCVTHWLHELLVFRKRVQSDDEGEVKKEVITKPRGGNPGPFHSTSISWQRNQGQVTYCLIHLNTTAEFDPSKQGKIQLLDFVFHLKNLDVSPGTTVKHAFVIKQDGHYFCSPKATLSNTKDWHGFVINDLTPTYFKRLGTKSAMGQPQVHPNFATGGPMVFGYAVFISTDAIDGHSMTGVDNWRVSIVHSNRKKEEKLKGLERALQEQERLQRLIIEEKLKAEQEVRRVRFKAEEEVREMQLQVEKMQQKKEVAPVSIIKRQESPSKPPLTRETSENKYQEYLAVVKAVQTKLRNTLEQHKAEKEGWEKIKGELVAKNEDVLAQLEAERKRRGSFESKLTADFEEFKVLQQEEKQKLSYDIVKQNEVVAQFKERISVLERELVQESSNKRKREEELKVLAEEAREAQTLRARLEELSQQNSDLARDLAELEAQLKAVLREKEEGAEILASLQVSQLALKEELDEQVARLEKELAERSANEALLKERCGELEGALSAATGQVKDKDKLIAILRESGANVERSKEETESLLLAEREKFHALKKAFKETKKTLRQERGYRNDTEKVLKEERNKMEALKAELAEEAESRASIQAELMAVKESKKWIEQESADLRERLSEQQKEAEEKSDLHRTEKNLRERLAEELNLAVQERKEAEIKHEMEVKLLSAKLKKHTVLAESLREETIALQQVQEELEMERIARMKAEDALKKLEEIFLRGSSDEAEDWEMVSDEEGGETLQDGEKEL